MKNRHFQMLYYLMEHGRTSASVLSEYFEVSVRTIYRDIDQLSGAGIPVYATQGLGGGIEIDSSFMLSTGMFSKEEQGELLSALESSRQMGSKVGEELYGKLSTMFPFHEESWLQIDFSNWGETSKFQRLKNATQNHDLLEFVYYTASGESEKRLVEPVKMWLKHTQWYLWGYCRNRGDFRLFRLTRMKDVRVLEEKFTPKIEAVPKYDSWSDSATKVELVLLLDKKMEHRLMDEFSGKETEELESGKILVTGTLIEDSWLYGYLLSFGSGMTVLSPPYIRDILREESKKITELYKT